MDTKKDKELAKLVKLCRKLGVIHLKMDGIEVSLSPVAPTSNYKKKSAATDTESPPQFSEEETLFWSSAGLPDQPEAQ